MLCSHYCDVLAVCLIARERQLLRLSILSKGDDIEAGALSISSRTGLVIEDVHDGDLWETNDQGSGLLCIHPLVCHSLRKKSGGVGCR